MEEKKQCCKMTTSSKAASRRDTPFTAAIKQPNEEPKPVVNLKGLTLDFIYFACYPMEKLAAILQHCLSMKKPGLETSFFLHFTFQNQDACLIWGHVACEKIQYLKDMANGLQFSIEKE